MMQIIGQSRSDILGYGQSIGIPAVCPNPQFSCLPIEILESKPTYLAHSQAVHREEQKNGSIPDLGSCVTGCAGTQSLDLVPGGSCR